MAAAAAFGTFAATGPGLAGFFIVMVLIDGALIVWWR
jgi:hypothetical protein